MKMQPALKSFLQANHINDIAMCLYPLSIMGEVEDPPPLHRESLCFYHMEKAGGLAVHSALQNTMDLMAQAMKPPPHYTRFHASDPEETRESLLDAIREAPEVNIFAYVGIVGQKTYGIHKDLPGQWRLMTLLRDPFDRVVSHYFYLIRRQARPGPISEADFLDYAFEWRRTNYFCRMLTEHNDANSDYAMLYDEARNNLSTFDFVDTVDNIERALLHVWSYYQLPLFLSQKLHSNPHKTNEFEHLRDDFYERNRYDMMLYKSVEEKFTAPIDIQPDDTSITLSNAMNLMIDPQFNVHYKGTALLLRSQDFMETAQRDDIRSLEDAFKALCPKT